MNAPEPNFTSSTRRSSDSASFLLMMLATMSGCDGTVAVTSRKRVELLVRGADVRGLADHHHADARELRERCVFAEADVEAGDALEFVERAAGDAEAAAARSSAPTVRRTRAAARG